MTDPILSPYLIVEDARAAIDFYHRAFGAVAGDVLVDPGDGRIGHAELRFGQERMMIADEYPDFGAVSPGSLGGSPVRLHLTVDDPDAVFAGAIDAGAIEQRPMKAQFHGGRSGTLIDPFGHIWIVASDGGGVTAAQAQARWNEMAAR